jgi:hypothetical protein
LESAVLHFSSWATLFCRSDKHVGLLHLSSFLSCLFILFAWFVFYIVSYFGSAEPN